MNSEQEKDRILDILISRLSALWEAGSPVAGSTPVARREMASLALRRFQSTPGRDVPINDFSAQTSDLARGLIAAFEANPQLVGPLKIDYEYVAGELLAAIQHATNELGASTKIV